MLMLNEKIIFKMGRNILFHKIKITIKIIKEIKIT